MSYIFNKSPSPSLFGHMHFRTAYTLLPSIRKVALDSVKKGQLNVISIACGTSLELACFEMLARSLELSINYIGCDINKSALKFNYHVLGKRSKNIHQRYIHSDIASSPPSNYISNADCIIWRHPEFLSDHVEVPKTLILKMTQILWNILQVKNKDSSIFISCYDPHEMLLVIELLKEFCNKELDYELYVDTQKGRASIDNPMVSREDTDPIFNLNHHDQFQLTINNCKPIDMQAESGFFLNCLSMALKAILCQIPTKNEIGQLSIIGKLAKPDLNNLRAATEFLNNEIRNANDPFGKRNELSELLTQTIEPVCR